MVEVKTEKKEVKEEREDRCKDGEREREDEREEARRRKKRRKGDLGRGRNRKISGERDGTREMGKDNEESLKEEEIKKM